MSESGYLIMPLDQLAASTPRELAAVLQRVAIASGRERKELALTSGIHRSQLYRLIDPRAATMPRKPEQLKELLRACRLHPVLVNAVLLQWYVIKRDRRGAA